MIHLMILMSALIVDFMFSGSAVTMTRRKQKQLGRMSGNTDIHFRLLREPYHLATTDSMADYYQRYLEDADGVLEIGDIIYYKIIQAHSMILRNRPIFFAIIDNAIDANIHDVLADENENIFKITSIEMMSFGGLIPEWYFKTTSYVLEPGDVEIGEYLRLLG